MTERKPGRPRAIPESVIPRLLRLYHEGLGYRAIARELSKVRVRIDWSTVHKVIKSRGYEGDTKNGLQTIYNTILLLDISNNLEKNPPHMQSAKGNVADSLPNRMVICENLP